MTAIITGDIIGAKKLVATENWIEPLKSILYNYGTTPKNWEIQRGDSFQLEIKNPEESLLVALKIKASVKRVRNMDVRLSVGIGEKTFHSDTISSSNGSAFIRSIKGFEELRKRKKSLIVSTGNSGVDEDLNLTANLLMSHADNWSKNAAELIYLSLSQPKLSQTELARELNITQATVSVSLKRSYFNLLIDCEKNFRKKIENL